MPANEAIRVHGLRDLQRAFKLADASAHKQLRVTLRNVAEPVRVDAERIAVSEIRRIGIRWSRMRIGVTATSVYVAPRQRGRLSRQNSKLRRPNLAGLLLHAETSALDRNRPRVIDSIEQMLAEVGREWERA